MALAGTATVTSPSPAMSAASSFGDDSSVSVVELRRVADVEDTATSAGFFGEDDGATSTFSWPELETTPKRTSQRELQDICAQNKVPAGYTPTALYGLEAACRTPPAGSICVYADALEAGMKVPLHDFYVAVLRHYGLAPSQLAPSAWRYMAAFVLLCEDAGVQPMLSVFRFFFSICNTSAWYHFRHYAVVLPGDPGAGHRRIFTGRLPRRRRTDWRSRFFLLQSPSTAPWPCPVKWGKPSRAAVRTPTKSLKSSDTTTAIQMLLDKAGPEGIDLMTFLSGRSLPVGTQATITPEQRAVKVEQGAAAGPRSEPTTPTTRKRKSIEIDIGGQDVPASCGSHSSESQAQLRYDGMSTPPGLSLVGQRQSCSSAVSNTREFAITLKGVSELAAKAVEELEEKEKELLESRGEITQLRAELAKLRREHDDKVAHLTKRLKEEHDARIAQLTINKQLKEEHAAQVAKLNRESIARLKPIVEKEMDAMKDKVLALFPNLGATLFEEMKASLLQPASRTR